MSSEKKRVVLVGSRITINAAISLCITAALILSSFFIFKGIETHVSGKDFWIQKSVMAVATFLLMFSIANVTENIMLAKDKDINDRLNALDTHYQTIMANYETADLETYIENLNKANKYKNYIHKWKKKLRFASRFKKWGTPKRLERINKALTVTAEELWESGQKVKYHRITFSQMVSGANDVSPNDDESDLRSHKARYGAQKFDWKIISLVAFGAFSGQLLYSWQDFNKGMIIPLIFQCVTILISIYSGICFGCAMNERTKQTLKRKLKIFSQFRYKMNNKVNGVANLGVEVIKDLEVERAKEKSNNPVKRTFDDTFGSGQPVKAGAFVGKLISSTIDIEAEKMTAN